MVHNINPPFPLSSHGAKSVSEVCFYTYNTNTPLLLKLVVLPCMLLLGLFALTAF